MIRTGEVRKEDGGHSTNDHKRKPNAHYPGGNGKKILLGEFR